MALPARQALRRLLPYYHPYRQQVAVGLSAVVIAAALASVIPSLLRQGIDAMRAGATLGPLLRIAAVMLVTALASGALRFLMRQLLNGISRNIETDLRRDLFARLVTLDPSWYVRWRTGDLMARMTNDLGAVRLAAGPAVMYLVNTLAGALFATIMMIRISPSLTAAALLPMLGLPVLMIRLGRQVHERFEAVQSQFSGLSTRAQENIAGVRVVRAYQQEAAESARFDALGNTYLEANMRLAKLNGLMNPGFALLAGLGGAITIAVGGRQLIEGRITVGGYVAFGIYLALLTWPMIALGWTTNLFQRGAASMSRVLELLDGVPLAVQDTGTAQLPDGAIGRTIEFRNVSFRYPAALSTNIDGAALDAQYASTDGSTDGSMENGAAERRWILHDVSFTVPAGGTLAVVGATGSGKSALMDLIPRLFDPQEGEILIDGVLIRDVPLDTLRREIGYVPQESLLFSETVGENVSYGLSDDRSRADEVTDAVTDAADIAQLSDTVASLPDGFDTRLGERGINLSGGQKQRTALARALARRPRIVMLDDALSAVDTHTEAAILAGLRGALAGRTALIASHRISTVRDADLIIVLDNGSIVEQGTHDALIAAQGRYARLLQRQQLLDDIEAGSDAAA
ncbi:MAG TPA: ABC transporter ATP-binding protein [Gemmatimonas sp.]|nr:ABC transporter ATP-binding protein [Gemmatimonas sp.]